MADGRSDDGVLMFLFLVAIIWGGGWLIWKNFRVPLSNGIFAVRSVEMAIADIWLDDDDIIQVPMPTKTDDEAPLKAQLGDNERTELMNARFGTWKEFVRNVKPEELKEGHVSVSTYVALKPLRYLFTAIFAGLFIWVIFTGPTSKFRRVMGLEALIHDQSRMFKVIRPFLKFNPNKLPTRPPGSPVPVDLPLFAEALNPEEWIAVNEIEVKNGEIDRAAAEAALAQQLGPRWKGADALPNELKILLAAFCLKASRKRAESDEMLGRLCACWEPTKGLKLSRDRGLLRESRKILRDKKLSEKVLLACNRHTYVSTALMRALDTARADGGVLASSQFIWLRGVNRALWYPLNNLGRDAYHIEALGVCAHYRSEKQLNRPIPRPNVAHAVDGIRDLIKDPIFARPIPPVDYGKGGKKSKPKKAA